MILLACPTADLIERISAVEEDESVSELYRSATASGSIAVTVEDRTYLNEKGMVHAIILLMRCLPLFDGFTLNDLTAAEGVVEISKKYTKLGLSTEILGEVIYPALTKRTTDVFKRVSFDNAEQQQYVKENLTSDFSRFKADLPELLKLAKQYGLITTKKRKGVIYYVPPEALHKGKYSKLTDTLLSITPLHIASFGIALYLLAVYAEKDYAEKESAVIRNAFLRDYAKMLTALKSGTPIMLNDRYAPLIECLPHF